MNRRAPLNRVTRPVTKVALGIFLAFSIPLPGWSKLALFPIFSDHMVLQRSAQTILQGYGAAPGSKVWVKYNGGGKAWTSVAQSDGLWQVELNLTNASKYRSPCAFAIGEGKKSRPSLELTNVVLGDVWLLAIPEGQGTQAPPNDNSLLQPEKIRFLNLRGIEPTANPVFTKAPVWQQCPGPRAAERGRFSALAICLAESMSFSTNVNLAFIEVATELLDESFEAGDRVAEKAPRTITAAHNRANQNVREAQAERWHRLVEAKRQGIVTNIPEILEYGPLTVYPQSAFSPLKPPTLRLSFKGAIWVRRPLSASRPAS